MRRLFLAIAALAAASPALAEPPPNSRIDRKPMAVVDTANDPVVSRVVNQYARCVANSRPEWTDRVLAMGLLTKEQLKLTNKEATGIHSCFSTSQFDLYLSSLSFLGGLAEQRISERFGSRPVEGLASITDQLLFASAAAPTSTVEDLAACIARKDPTLVRRLIDTKPMSIEEAAAVQRLVPHLGGCVPQGLRIRFNRQTVRAYAALGLHRLLANEGVLRTAERG